MRVLLTHLPPQSATMTALRNRTPDSELDRLSREADPSKGSWSQSDMLIAQLIDAVRELTTVTCRLNGAKVTAPDPVARPGVAPKAGSKERGRPSAAGHRALLGLIHPELNQLEEE